MSVLCQGKRILITGALGFLGKALWLRLQRDNTIIPAGPYYDLMDYRTCRSITYGVDYVFHFANRMGGIKYIVDNGPEVMLNNSLANANLIKASVENKVKRFFFPSSFCVYRQTLQTGVGIHELAEDTDAIPADPDTYYGWEKIFTEKMLEAFSKKMQVRIARFVSIYGPGNHYKGGKEKVIPALCRKVAEAKDGDEIEVFGDGTQIRSFCYIDDCLDAIIAIMEGDYDKPLNVDGPDSATVSAITNMVIEASGKQLKIKYVPTEVKGVDFRMASIFKIKHLLGWKPEIKLKEGIQKTYEWVEREIKK